MGSLNSLNEARIRRILLGQSSAERFVLPADGILGSTLCQWDGTEVTIDGDWRMLFLRGNLGRMERLADDFKKAFSPFGVNPIATPVTAPSIAGGMAFLTPVSADKPDTDKNFCIRTQSCGDATMLEIFVKKELLQKAINYYQKQANTLVTIL